MTTEQRQHLERRLHEERERTLESLTRAGRELGVSEREQDSDLSAYPLHPADKGSDNHDREVAFSLAGRETEILHEIDAALERLYKHPAEFGRCSNCEGEIPFARLDLVPWAHECDGELRSSN
jgi:RNA polymerase-binding transcription factor DksA